MHAFYSFIYLFCQNQRAQYCTSPCLSFKHGGNVMVYCRNDCSVVKYLWSLEKNEKVKSENRLMTPMLRASDIKLHKVGGLHMDPADDW